MDSPHGFHVRSVNSEKRAEAKRVTIQSVHPREPKRENILLRLAAWVRRQWVMLGWKKFCLRTVGIIACFFVLYLAFLWFTLPNLDDPTLFAASQSTAITDRNGVELYRVYGEQDRTVIPGDQIPQSLKNAVIAIEDQRFFQRGCIDWRAPARVLFPLRPPRGAPPHTPPLARNPLNLQRENVVSRKIKELFLGCELEWHFSKPDLLNLYLNWVPFGQNAYGVEEASQRYLGKSAKDLDLAQSAVLASLPQLPSYYSPYGRHVHTAVSGKILAQIQGGRITAASQIPQREVSIGLLGAFVGSGAQAIYLGGRTDQVLHNMEEQGFIKADAAQSALEELRTMQFKPSRDSIRAPHFVLWMRDQVEQMFQGSADTSDLLQQGGLTIQTTLDWNLQQAAEQAIAAHKDDILKRFGAHNIALVAVDPRTREVLAYVGNTTFDDSTREGKIDMAQVPRQPGSSFKPFVYAEAFQKGYGPATILYDVQTKFGDYVPQNYEGNFYGLMDARQALGGSRNIPAIKAYFLAGEENTILDFAQTLGVTSPKKNKPIRGYGPTLAIGTAETPLIEMVQGYATFADGGKFKPLISIGKITDRHGSLLPLPTRFDPAETSEQVLDPRIAYMITSVLSDPSVRPGDYWRNILTVPGIQAAAKTGTSNKCLDRANDASARCTKRKPEDVWTIGYTPDLAVGVWVGNANSDVMSDSADGINVAAPVWKDFMVKAHKVLPAGAAAFTQPDGLIQPQISLLSGQLPTDCTPVDKRRPELFLSEKPPTQPDPACQTMLVDKVTGLLASDTCPADAQEQQSFFVPHSILADRWPSWEQGVQAWAQSQQSGSGGALPLPLPPTQKCDIGLTPGRLVQPTLQILSPTAGGIASYPSFEPKIQWTVGSTVKEVDYLVDGRQIASVVDPPFQQALRIPRSIQASGLHTLSVKLVDSFYNTVTQQVTFSFRNDTTSPTVRITSPQNGMAVPRGSSLAIDVDASDEGGIKYVEFYLDSTLLTRQPHEPFSVSYPLPPSTPSGEHVIRAVATDMAGNTGQDQVTVAVQ